MSACGRSPRGVICDPGSCCPWLSSQRRDELEVAVTKVNKMAVHWEHSKAESVNVLILDQRWAMRGGALKSPGVSRSQHML